MPLVCTPASAAQELGVALGAQAGDRRLTEMLNGAGFGRVHGATQTPFNPDPRRARVTAGRESLR
jgi:hypothetical protein